MDNLDKVIEIVLKDAAKKRESAGYNGEMGDGGAGRLEEQVKFYNYGRLGVVPDEWKKYSIQLDPEYEVYQRLKKKFENR